MESNYVITSSGTFVHVNELYHHGILGMKWGVRRYQNADGSLTAAGKKRYANPDGSLNEKGKKKFGDSVVTAETTKKSSGSSDESESKTMTDVELQNRVNRLRNEDAYRDLSKKLGYDTPKTELDMQIADMEKQKKYLELKRDIKKLTAETKEVSAGKKFIDNMVNKVVAPAATEAGKKLLTQYLTEAGTQAVGKKSKQETNKIDKTVKKSAERVKEKEEKQKVKEEAKAAKQSAKSERADQTVYTGKVEKNSNSSNNTSNTSSNSKTSKIYDMTLDSDGVYRYSNSSAASSTVTKYLNTPVSNLLPAQKDDDD